MQRVSPAVQRPDRLLKVVSSVGAAACVVSLLACYLLMLPGESNRVVDTAVVGTEIVLCAAPLTLAVALGFRFRPFVAGAFAFGGGLGFLLLGGLGFVAVFAGTGPPADCVADKPYACMDFVGPSNFWGTFAMLLPWLLGIAALCGVVGAVSGALRLRSRSRIVVSA